MKNTTEQFIQEAKNLRMSATEKADMRHLLSVHARTPSSGPAAVTTFAPWIRRHAMASALALIVIIVGATGVSAHRAGPEDLLYGFRVKVNNRVQAALVLDEDKKLAVELEQIEKQLFEEELSAEDELEAKVDVTHEDGDVKDGDEDLNEIIDIEKEILDAEADVRVDLEI